ncbi:MAG: cytidylate kinase-like family protein, partial [Anaerolineae bacterium]|nr:cytidylate kinase-like family protein [Anaerolineae bacterium]
DQYRLRGFFEALFRRARPVAEVSSWAGGRTQGYEREVRTLDEDRAIDLVRATVLAAYDRGDVLIIGRGSQAILEDKPDVLHVRVVAPFEDRIARLQASESISAAQARRFITDSDRATQEYLHTFHHVDVDDPTLYHMVLNTGKLGIERTVYMIRQGLHEMAAAA